MPSLNLNISTNPSSCLIVLGKNQYRSLIDSGADCCIINKRIYDKLSNKPPLLHEEVGLNSVNGSSLVIHGYVNLPFQIGSSHLIYKFYVVSNINRNFILGRNWLHSYGVRLYYDNDCLRINNEYIPLVQDVHISSLVRTINKIKIKPQETMFFPARVKKSADLSESGLYQVLPVNHGFISHQPGLVVSHGICKANKSNKFSMAVTNSTNHTFVLRRGCIVGRVESVQAENVIALADLVNSSETQSSSSINQSDIDVPPEHKQVMCDFLSQNTDLFAATDLDLTQTSTVKMTVDTADHPPIKLRPYRTPLHQRPVVDKALDEMLAADVIRPSTSPWSFPIVIVSKKDSSKRFCVDFRHQTELLPTSSYRRHSCTTPW